MADETVQESAQVEPEAEEKPTPRVPSAQSEAQQTSEPADDLDRIEQLVDQAVARRQQSLKDRRIADLQKKVEALLGEDQRNDAPSERPASGRADEGEEDAAYMEAMSEQILSGANIALDDPDYEALVERYEGRITSADRWEKIVREFATTHQNKDVKQQTVSEAAKVSSPAESAEVSSDVDALTEELSLIQAGTKGSPLSPENRKRQEELIARLNELDPQINVDDPNINVDLSPLHRYSQ